LVCPAVTVNASTAARFAGVISRRLTLAALLARTVHARLAARRSGGWLNRVAGSW